MWKRSLEWWSGFGDGESPHGDGERGGYHNGSRFFHPCDVLYRGAEEGPVYIPRGGPSGILLPYEMAHFDALGYPRPNLAFVRCDDEAAPLANLVEGASAFTDVGGSKTLRASHPGWDGTYFVETPHNLSGNRFSYSGGMTIGSGESFTALWIGTGRISGLTRANLFGNSACGIQQSASGGGTSRLEFVSVSGFKESASSHLDTPLDDADVFVAAVTRDATGNETYAYTSVEGRIDSAGAHSDAAFGSSILAIGAFGTGGCISSRTCRFYAWEGADAEFDIGALVDLLVGG